MTQASRGCAAPPLIGRSESCMVITMNWMTRYYNRDEFLTWFLCEQEYVDAMFIQMIMFNFGVWLDMDELHAE